MQKILIIGSEGAMGKRYQAIFVYLNKVFDYHFLIETYDIANDKSYPDFFKYDFIIVTSPTFTHEYYLKELINFKKPILCEKPLIKNLNVLKGILDSSLDVQMMFQYAFLTGNNLDDLTIENLKFNPNPIEKIESSYDYFKTSNITDELPWDCMQIIALHNGPVHKCFIKNHSPLWQCSINGEVIDLRLMDHAYISAVKYWLGGGRIDKKVLYFIHEKIHQFIKSRP